MNVTKVLLRRFGDARMVERDGLQRGPYLAAEFALNVAKVEAIDLLKTSLEVEILVLGPGGGIASSHLVRRQ